MQKQNEKELEKEAEKQKEDEDRNKEERQRQREKETKEGQEEDLEKKEKEKKMQKEKEREGELEGKEKKEEMEKEKLNEEKKKRMEKEMESKGKTVVDPESKDLRENETESTNDIEKQKHRKQEELAQGKARENKIEKGREKEEEANVNKNPQEKGKGKEKEIEKDREEHGTEKQKAREKGTNQEEGKTKRHEDEKVVRQAGEDTRGKKEGDKAEGEKAKVRSHDHTPLKDELAGPRTTLEAPKQSSEHGGASTRAKRPEVVQPTRHNSEPGVSPSKTTPALPRGTTEAPSVIKQTRTQLPRSVVPVVAPVAIGPFSAGSPLVRRNLPVIIDSLPSANDNPFAKPPLRPLSPHGSDGKPDSSFPTPTRPSSKNNGGSEDGIDGGYGGSESPGTEDEEDDVAGAQDQPRGLETETVIGVDRPLKTATTDVWPAPAAESDILRMGEGVGSLAYDRSPTGSRNLNRELRRRLEVQDCATLAMLIVTFFATVFVSCYGIYQVSDDPSPVAFYSDPRAFQRRLTCQGSDMDSFLQAFNGQPQHARLRIIGRQSLDPSLRGLLLRGAWAEARRVARGQLVSFMYAAGILHQRHHRQTDGVLFDVSLDVTPFIAGNGRLHTDADTIALQKYINSSNPLEVVLLRKKVLWPHWEDIATNVRQRLRTLGFDGEVEVRFEAFEEVKVFRNHPWQNFVRSRITQALVLISVIGGLIWVPYVWLRMRRIKIETSFVISLDLQRYWDLFSDGLHPTLGFVTPRQ
eukprot:TRINITY_DN33088_c0_g1_i5.p1 TRINITY_DN33088_c0_g1~~TRINITY_DN33088_c0_g1_i5.p1  ORF type:complete len:751 (-),score=186.14 TRINITY_DN33088_c0_g1_i5:170-2422(-)